MAGWTLGVWTLGAAWAGPEGGLRLVLHEPAQDAPADRCDAELCTSLLSLIEGARSSIDLAFYGFRDQSRLLAALRAARDRGVEIRGVVDADVEGRNYYASTAEWMALLPSFRTDQRSDLAAAADRAGEFLGIRHACPRPPGTLGPLQCLAFDLGGGRCYLAAHASAEPIRFEGDILHDKFAVVDGRYVWTGSTNASDSGTGGYNANLAMVVDSPRVASWYRAEFEQMYVAGRFHRDKERQGPMRTVLDDGTGVEVHFSPQHQPLTRVVVPLVASARQRIDVSVFYLTHKAVTQALLDAHARGVRVRVLLDATGAANAYSKHEVLRAAGIPVKVEDLGGKMHAKAAVFDGRVLVAGSMNWTRAGEEGNDENTLVIASPRHAEQLSSWFERTWARTDDRWLAGRPDPESADSGTSCTDGVDNDYDERTDAADPGCGPAPPPLPAPVPAVIVASGGQPCSWRLLPEGRSSPPSEQPAARSE